MLSPLPLATVTLPQLQLILRTEMLSVISLLPAVYLSALSYVFEMFIQPVSRISGRRIAAKIIVLFFMLLSP